MKSRAFVILFVLLVCATLSYFILAAWHQASLNYELNLERKTFYENLNKTETILNIGFVFLRQNFDNIFVKIKKNTNPVVIDCSNWAENLLLKKSKKQKIHLTLSKFENKKVQPKIKMTPKRIYVSATLSEKDMSLCRLSAVFSKLESNVKQCKTKKEILNENKFMVECFTF